MPILASPPLQEFLRRHSDHADPRRPVAVFDCDGTVIQGDIGEAMFYAQIERFHFRISPADVWEDYPGRQDLERWYRTLRDTEPRRRAGHPDFPPFADSLLGWYSGQLAEGKIEKGCSDIVRLFAGYSVPEVRAIAEETVLAETESPVGTRKLGTRTVPRGVRFIRETVELLAALRDAGFGIWAVSGSNRWSVERVFRRLGVHEDHVIGIGLKESTGILTADVPGPVPVLEGKVLALQAVLADPPALVASDSRLDSPMLQYSAGLKVLVNSRKGTPQDFFESTGIVRGDDWLVIESPTTEPSGAWQTSL